MLKIESNLVKCGGSQRKRKHRNGCFAKCISKGGYHNFYSFIGPVGHMDIIICSGKICEMGRSDLTIT